MAKPKFVPVHQNGDAGPVVQVSEAYAQNLDLVPVDSASEQESPKRSVRRAESPSHQSGGRAASLPEEAEK